MKDEKHIKQSRYYKLDNETFQRLNDITDYYRLRYDRKRLAHEWTLKKVIGLFYKTLVKKGKIASIEDKVK